MNSILTTPENRELVTSFTVHGEPISKARARFTKRGSKVVSYTPQKTLDGEKATAAAYLAEAKHIDPDAEATFAVYAHFINGTRQRRDVDNMVKLILDGLNGVAWPDDNQVTEIAARKSFGSKSDARTEVTIYRVGEMARPSRDCNHCGKAFRVYESTPDAIFCSRKCLAATRAAARLCVCKTCGDEFDGKAVSSKKPTYCSMACKSLDMTAEVACLHCGSKFRKPRSQSKGNVHFCTDECRDIHGSTCRHGHQWSEHIKYRPDGRRYCGECNRVRRHGGKGPARIILEITEQGGSQ